MQRFSRWVTQLTLGILTVGMAVVRPLLGPRGVCRFTPTCSQYAKEAIVKYGALKGCYLAARRLLKCHPFHEGGYDPVP